MFYAGGLMRCPGWRLVDQQVQSKVCRAPVLIESNSTTPTKDVPSVTGILHRLGVGSIKCLI